MRTVSIALFFWLLAFPAFADTYVIDGDTIRADGVTYRIIGIDTPETSRAKCESERQRGYEAKAYMIELLSNGYTIEARGLDKYRRRLATLWIGQVNVSDIMIARGHARAYSGRTGREGWC